MFSKGNDSILDALDGIENYLKNDINSINKIDKDCTGFNKKVKDKLNNIIEIMNQKNDEELLVYGEIMLICEKLSEGYLNDKIYHTNINNPKLNYISKTINSLIDNQTNIVNSILKILEEYSKHNYTNSLNLPNVKGEFNSLINGVNSFQKTITAMLIENKSNGLTLDDSSISLLENVDNLNISSNDTAARLEETSAALQDVTTNIRQNSENIYKMANLSNNLNISAKSGEDLATNTSNAMHDLNEEVKSVNDAITIIDQIAFQTNILSLNAAVEAATAGEAGKGFAVVAGEVRNLANRSAEAAKQIKNIVENASTKAQEGENIASKMIEGYKDLNQNIFQTTKIIDEISKSSKEQLNAIEQINSAISSIDQQTQRNASIATNAHDIAMLMDKISNIIISNANAKEFIGKDSVKAKSF